MYQLVMVKIHPFISDSVAILDSQKQHLEPNASPSCDPLGEYRARHFRVDHYGIRV